MNIFKTLKSNKDRDKIHKEEAVRESSHKGWDGLCGYPPYTCRKCGKHFQTNPPSYNMLDMALRLCDDCQIQAVVSDTTTGI